MPPVGLFIAGAAAGAAGTAPLALVPSAFAFGATVGAFATSAVGISLILGGAALAVAATRSRPGKTTTATQQNIRQAIPPRLRYYGENLTGGYWALYHSIISGFEANPAIFYGVLVTGHGESNAILDRYLNGRRITAAHDQTMGGVSVFSKLDNVDYLPNDNAYSRGDSTLIKNYLGTAAQISDPYFNTLDGGDLWDSDHRLRGCTVAYIIYNSRDTPEHQTQDFPGGGLPVYTERRECSKIYDPRSSLTEYSENSALVIADALHHNDAFNLGNTNIDWANIEEEADFCDNNVTIKGGGTIKRYRSAGGYSMQEPRGDWLTDLLASADAVVIPRPNGKVGIKVGRYDTPTVEVTAKSILRFQGRRTSPGPGEVNTIVPTYTDRRLSFKETESTGYSQVTSDWGTMAGTERIAESVSLLWIPHHNQAVRIAKRILAISRAEWTIDMTLDAFGLMLMAERFFYLTYNERGFNQRPFEIQNFKIVNGGMAVQIQAISVSPDDWSFTAADEEPDPPAVPFDPDHIPE